MDDQLGISLRERIRINLTSAMDQAGINQVQLAEKLGISKGTVNNWVRGNNSPDVDMVPNICSVLGIPILDLYSPTKFEKTDCKTGAEKLETDEFAQEGLSVGEQAHIKKYRILDGHGKDMVDTVLGKEYIRCVDLQARRERTAQTEESAEIGAESVYYVLPRYDTPMSAGTGQLAGQERPENEYLIKEPPRGTSYIAPVCGDSMEPTYSDGDLLFVCSVQEVETGQIGVFLMDGQQWVKELGDGELISHNPAYDSIPITEDIRCQGLVLGVCDESYFE